MKLKIVYAAAAFIFITGLIGSILVLQRPNANTVEVVRDGEVLYRFDMDSAEDQTFIVEYGDSYNLIEISGGRVRVKDAGCKDHTCVNMGWLDSSAPVVCLPNRLIIRFSGSNKEVDAVAG